jgi:hypothetical protein
MAAKENYQLVTESFDLGSDRPGDNKAQALARAFLRRLMTDNPNGIPGKAKRDFKEECEQRFGTSNREFEQLWRDESARTGAAAAWRKRGPRGPHRARKN